MVTNREGTSYREEPYHTHSFFLATCCLQPLGLTFGDGVPAGDTAHTVIEYNS